MPDFVKENGLEANEVVLQASKEAELSKSHFLNEQELERKTLYEQLQESKGMLNWINMRFHFELRIILTIEL